MTAAWRRAATQGPSATCASWPTPACRTGTLIAAYLVKARGLTVEAAIAEIRRVRPGSVETPAQEAAVRAYAER